MQVFVPDPSPLECAGTLDMRRLNKQIIECRQILKAIRGESSAWVNHPCVKMYRDHEQWLTHYMHCLECYKAEEDLWEAEEYEESKIALSLAVEWDELASEITPPFLTDEFCEQHCRRLYTKDPEYYEHFGHLGTSEENWYFVDGELSVYKEGKLIRKEKR